MKTRHTYIFSVTRSIGAAAPGPAQTDNPGIGSVTWTLLITIAPDCANAHLNTHSHTRIYSCKRFKSEYIPIRGLRGESGGLT
jgi:hypothetical protein